MARPQSTVLVLDDSPICLDLTRAALEEGGFNVITTASALGFSRVLGQVRPDLVLVDVGMPSLSGDALVEILLRNPRNKCPIYLHSDRAEEELKVLVKKSRATGFIRKTEDGAALVAAVRRALEMA
jgi:DNA-binding response OmpR family regulator